MAQITARNIFYNGYSSAGMVELEGSFLNPDQEEDARQLYGMMVLSWSAEGYYVPHISRELFNLVANQSAYTIGPAANWVIDPMPREIDRAGVVLTTQTVTAAGPPEYEMKILTVDEWRLWTLKGQTTNFPWCLWYEKAGPPNGIVHVVYVPTDANKVALYLERPIQPIAAQPSIGGQPPNYSTVTLDLRPEFVEAIINNLALRILRRRPGKSQLDARAREDLKEAAMSGMRLISRNSIRPLSRETDLSHSGGRSNIWVGNRYFSR